MKQLTSQLPVTENLYFRADRGYFSENLLSYLEDLGYEYLIKVKMKNLSSVLENQTWSDIEDKKGWQETTFEYGCKSWETKRIFKAVRIEIPGGKPNEILLNIKRYSYFCYVTTDLHSTPWEVHKRIW